MLKVKVEMATKSAFRNGHRLWKGWKEIHNFVEEMS